MHRLHGLRVALDVGHSIQNPGAGSARGRGEFYFNQDTTRIIAGKLREAGATVIVINDDGTVMDLVERTILAAKAKADVFISIHHDSCNQKYKEKWTVDGKVQEYCDKFSGYSVFCSKSHPLALKSRELALALGETMLGQGFKPTPHHNEPIPGENRPFIDEKTGVYEFTDLIVVKRTSMPAVLLECGVIVHRDEELEVQKPDYQNRIAVAVTQALAEGHRNGLFLRDVSSGSPPPAIPLNTVENPLPVRPNDSEPPPEKKKGLLRRFIDRGKE